MRKAALFLAMMFCVMVATSGCLEQKFPHGKQVKPDNIEEKKE